MKTSYLADEIFEYIKTKCEEGLSPTIREICAALNIKSTSTAHKYVELLVEQGKIEKLDNLTRTLRIPGMSCVMIPFYKNITDTIDWKKSNGYIPFLAPKNTQEHYFAFCIKNNDLMSLGILLGDIAIAKLCDPDRNEKRTINLPNTNYYVHIVGSLRLYKEY